MLLAVFLRPRLTTSVLRRGAICHASTVQSDEINKFSRLRNDWWTPDGAFRALHKMNPVRVQFIEEELVNHFALPATPEGSPLEGIKLLDVGCGGGILAEVDNLHCCTAHIEGPCPPRRNCPWH
jgi:hypothetical protein